MTEAIAIALIGVIGSAFGSLCGVLVSSKVTQHRLEQLEKKVEKHNNLVERMYQLEERSKLLERDLEAQAELYAEKIRAANYRITEMENERKA